MNSRNNVKGDNRPTDYEYACLSKHVYNMADTTLEVGTKFQTPFHSWTIAFVSAPNYCGYFGAVYECEETKQYVIVHRGTNNVVDYLEDYWGIIKNYLSFQKSEAFRVVDLIVQKIKSKNSTHSDYSLSFTGHSLGGFLTELSVYYSTVVLNFPEVHGVSFESPGSLESMQSLCLSHLSSSIAASSSWSISNVGGIIRKNPFKNILPSSTSWPSLINNNNKSSETSHLQSYLAAKDFNSIIQKLDIIAYVCYPNIVNTCNEHVGTLFAINVFMEDYKRIWPHRLVSSHSMTGIVEWFKKSAGGDPRYVKLLMTDWPKSYAASRVFFKYAKFEDGMLSVKNLLDDNTSSRRQQVDWRTSGGEASSGVKRSQQLTKLSTKLTSVMGYSSTQVEKWIKKQKDAFQLKFYGNFDYDVHGSVSSALPLHHFSIPLQDFLKYFHEKRNYIFTKYNNKSKTTRKMEDLKKFLQETWKGFNMPKEVREELVSFNLQQNNKLFVKELVCNKCSVHDFRHLLSCWLEKTGFTVDELINIELVDEVMWKLRGLSISA